MMKNIEFIDHNECLLEMQIFLLLFCNYLNINWAEKIGYNKVSNDV